MPWISRILVCLLLCSALPVQAQEDMPPMGRPAEMDEMAFLVGEWDVVMNMRMAPDQPWMESEASATTEMILDGCVQRMTFEGNVMGMPLKGMDHLSYNRDTGKFESMWMDNMSARFSTMSGNLEGDQLVLRGHDQRMGQEFLVRTTSTKHDDDHVDWVMEESVDDGTTWYESMKMTYTRKK